MSRRASWACNLQADILSPTLCALQVREMCGLDPMPLSSYSLQLSGDLMNRADKEQLLSAHANGTEQLCRALEPPVLPVVRAANTSSSLHPYSCMLDGPASACSAAELDNSSTPEISTEDALLNLFAQRLQQPSLKLPAMQEPAAAEPVPGTKCFHTLPLLDVPAVPPDHSSVTVRQDIARAVLHSIPAVVITDPCADADFTDGTSFHDLVAPGQVLSDTFQMLPLVILDDPADAAAETSAVPVGSMLKGLQLKGRNLAVSELLLDWSLTDASAPDPTLAGSRARSKLRAALVPEAIPCAEPALPALQWAEVLKEITGPPVHCSGLHSSPEQAPSAVQKYLCSKLAGSGPSLKGELSRENGRQEGMQNRTAPVPGADARLPLKVEKQDRAGSNGIQCGAKQPANVAEQPGSRAREVVAAGIFSRRPAKKARKAGNRDGASYFFGLQTGAVGSQDSSIDDSSSSSQDILLSRHGPCLINPCFSLHDGRGNVIHKGTARAKWGARAASPFSFVGCIKSKYVIVTS